ncbi:MAG: hypothetical protein RJQ08_08420 [Salinisphaeraceae bacterium]
MSKTKSYKTLRPFPHRGQVVPAGGKVELHPRQARYLLGTHLEDPDRPKRKAAASKQSPAPAKLDYKSTTTKGES